ncbi:MAG TPA: hypothetical protein VMH27_20640 [Puia sp.]|nr:hypothetical protein [Puia sp.]
METQKKPRQNKGQKPADSPKAGSKAKKQENKSAGDAAYNALQQRNDRLGAGRHAGDPEMNDENRSGGAGL